MPDNVINDFQERRRVEQALADLGDTVREVELVEGALRIAHGHSPALILPALLKLLDTPNGQLRGGLARVAALLPPEEVLPALRAYAADRRRAPQGRSTAAMIAERFLGEPLSPALTADLRDSDDAAFQSLAEAVEEGRRNRHVLLEYVTQMRPHGVEIALLVLHHLDRLPAPDRVGLLRLIAQDERPAVAAHALGKLQQLAEGEPGPAAAEAARALHTLRWALPPEQAAASERTLRKLQFRGRVYAPPSPAGWRSMLGTAQPTGALPVWFVRMESDAPGDPPEFAEGFMAGLLAGPRLGIGGGFFAAMPDRALLPLPAAVGTLILLENEAGVETLFLEVPFDVGRWLLRRALEAHHAGRARAALPGEYILYNDWLWEFDAPHIAPEIAALLELPGEGELEQLAPDGDRLDELFAHPGMAAWRLPVRRLPEEAAAAVAASSESPVEEAARAAVRALDAAQARAALQPPLQAGLLLAGLWFALLGRADLAAACRWLAGTLGRGPAADHPLLLHMVGRGIAEQRQRERARARRKLK